MRETPPLLSFDPREALDRLAGDEELLLEVVELVYEEWLRQSAALETAFRQSAPAAVAAAAHALKGVLGQLFSESLSAGVAQVERAARSRDLPAAEAAWRSTVPEIELRVAAARQWAREQVTAPGFPDRPLRR